MIEGNTRRLVAILAADVEGFSRLMGADEVATVATLSAHREITDRLISRHNGRIANTAGDSIIAVFDSAVDSVRAAVAIQAELVPLNAELPEERQVRFRIGVNLGDVILQGDDVLGDGVNIAARLESLADAGGICISHNVYDQVSDKLHYSYDYLGERQVKNIARPVRAYRIVVDGSAAATPTDVSSDTSNVQQQSARPGWAIPAVLVLIGVLAGIGWYWQSSQTTGLDPAKSSTQQSALSIVVLPFVNRTGHPESEYFADGITESLTADLARIQQAFIVNTATAFAYKNKPTTAQQVGKELGVRYVLQGSVQRSGDKIRINAQLADTKTNAQLWTEVFESDLSDLFALQDQVTTRISNSIERKMIVLAARESMTRKTTPKVADLILRARALRLKRQSLTNFQQAEALYREVLTIEPENSNAMAELSWSLAIQASNFGGSLDKAVAEAKYVESRNFALKAEAIDPNNPDPYVAIAFYARAHDDYAGYQRASETRHRLQPKNQGTTISLAVTYLWGGKPRQAIKYLNLANDLDPKRKRFLIPLNICRAYIMLGENDKAIENCLKAIELNPKFAVNYFFLAIAYAVKGDDAKMQNAVAELHKLAPNFRMTHLPQPSSPATYKEYFEKIQIPAARKAGLID